MPGSSFLFPNNVERGIGHNSHHGHRVRVRPDEVLVLGLVPPPQVLSPAARAESAASSADAAGTPNGAAIPSSLGRRRRTRGSRLGLVNGISIRRSGEDNAVWRGRRPLGRGSLDINWPQSAPRAVMCTRSSGSSVCQVTCQQPVPADAVDCIDWCIVLNSRSCCIVWETGRLC